MLQFYSVPADQLHVKLFETSCSEEFLQAWNAEFPETMSAGHSPEDSLFTAAQINIIPTYLREKSSIINKAKANDFKGIIQPSDIKGIIHSHSTWSDGSHTLEMMAEACIKKGFEYLVISDHSKSAFYAKGLFE